MRTTIFSLFVAAFALYSGPGWCQQRPGASATSQQQDAEQQRRARLAAWQALRKKPPLSGEANRNRVLAENAVQEKRFEDAARYYEAGLAAEPFWPQAQFNAALLRGELGHFAAAAAHGRAYLELVPDASDAPAMQEKIIIWDEKAKHPPPPPPPDPSTYPHFGVGDHVLCNWKSLGTMYHGWIGAQAGNRITVYYGDGNIDQNTVDTCQLVAAVSSFPILDIGDSVSCNWRGYGKFYGGKVIDREGGLVTVQYDSDNTRERITADLCKR